MSHPTDQHLRQFLFLVDMTIDQQIIAHESDLVVQREKLKESAPEHRATWKRWISESEKTIACLRETILAMRRAASTPEGTGNTTRHAAQLMANGGLAHGIMPAPHGWCFVLTAKGRAYIATVQS